MTFALLIGVADRQAPATQVNPDIRKEKWTEEEDSKLVDLVNTHGNCWAEIARGMAVSASNVFFRSSSDPDIHSMPLSCLWPATCTCSSGSNSAAEPTRFCQRVLQRLFQATRCILNK